MKLRLLFLAIMLSANFGFSQGKSIWQKQIVSSSLRVKSSKQDLPKAQIFNLNVGALKQALVNTPKRHNSNMTSNVVLSFPNSEGIFERYRIYETTVMDADLAERYPEIKSYTGQGIDDPSAVISFSVTPLGFQSMRLAVGKPASFIEAITSDASFYTVFSRNQKLNMNNDFECSVTQSLNKTMASDNVAYRNADDSILRTYRLAVSTTGEYTAYHGGTKPLALAAIVQTMVRVNGIFEVDFNVNMTLISNTDDVIYTNANTDPYTGNYNSQLQSTLTSVIGEANYDIGHLFVQGSNNGNAGCIGCVCVNNQKGSGFTSLTAPEGDLFDVDYVAHEMGHQFGANHTWTFNGNEGTNVQVEPGSGSTIMSYAGITGATDVQANVHPNFHAVSIEQVTDYVKSTSCQTNTPTGNSVPTVNAGSDYTIPRGTPFILEGTASDADAGDVLSYCWEQMDENNASTTYPSTTATTGVAFRAYEPVSDSFRYFPRLETIKTGATSWQWEAVPNVARTLNFRLTVRDNVAGGGTNNSDDVVLSVNGSAGPFVVNSPNTNVNWNAGTSQTVTWDVAGTTGNGVNTANVDIFLSTDGGDTYPITLALNVPNDGSHDIVVPNNQGTQNRIMVRGSNHIFFDISNTNFTISAPISCTATVPIGLAASNVLDTTATLSWDAVSGASYSLRYREVGSPTWITVAETGISYDISGLVPATQYEAQIRSECSGGSNSAYSSIVNFTTLSDTEAPIITLNGNSTVDVIIGDTYTELGATATDNVDGDLTSSIVIGGDTVDTNTLGTYIITYNVSDAAGNPAVEVTRTVNVILVNYCDSSGNTQYETGVTRVIFGSIDNVDGSPKDVGYEDFTNISTTVEQASTVDLTVYVDTDGPYTVHAFAWIDWNQNGDFTDSGEEYDLGSINNVANGALPTLPISVPLSAQLGNTRMRISVRYNSNPTPCLNNFDGEVEDYTVIVEAPGPDTTPPVITLNGNATIDVPIGGTYTELGATATDNVDGDLTSSIVIGGDTVDTNTLGVYTITYNVSDAAGNAAVEVTRAVNVVIPDYCDSNGNSTADEYINRVQLNTLDNNNSGVGTTSTGYSDFTSNPSLSTDLFSGTQYTITITPQWTGQLWDEGYAVWIDYNMDGDFEDAQELVWSQAPSQTSPVSGTFTLPAPLEVSYGKTRMRVSMKYNGIPTSCESFDYGEVEDYTVNIAYDGLLYFDDNWVPNAPNETSSADNVLIYNGTYLVSSNISINDIIINSGAVLETDPGQSITVGGNINNLGQFTLNSESNSYSSLLVDGVVTGDIEYNRHVNSNANGNDLIAPPVSGELFTDFISNNLNVFANGDQSLYLFGPFEKPVNEYQIFSSTEVATLTAATGYRTASTDDGTFTFTGAVTNTALNVPIVKTGVDFAKWNLIGNPYTSYIKLEDFLTANLSELDPQTVAVYGYDADDSNGSVWTIWNMAYSDANPNALIAPGQAFFVSSQDGGSTVSFTPSMRSSGIGDDFILNRNVNYAHFVLRMTSTENVYETQIYLKENTTMGLDIAYDAGVFAEEDLAPFMLYSELEDTNEVLKMAIQSIGFDDANNNTSIPLGVHLPQGTQVTISMNTSDLTYNVYLDDTVANTSTLLNTNDYVFTANTELFGSGRFYLRYEADTLSTLESDLDNIRIFSDSNADQIVVKGLLNDETNFVLYDVQGREVLSTELDISSETNRIDASSFSNGVYLVQLTNKTRTITKKLILR